jgi:hypothetical protein
MSVVAGAGVGWSWILQIGRAYGAAGGITIGFCRGNFGRLAGRAQEGGWRMEDRGWKAKSGKRGVHGMRLFNVDGALVSFGWGF